MATPINTIYSWFETGDFPTQEQFQASWSSFWHKDETIPMTTIEGLSDQFGKYVLVSTFNSHLNDQNAHSHLAKKDASNLSPTNINDWRTKLGVEDLPDNVATYDYDLPDHVMMKDGTTKEAGDLGKNIANSFLTSVTGAGMTLGAPYTWATNGQPFSVTGLANKSNDSTHNQFITKNSAGQLGSSNGKNLIIAMPTLMTGAEKNQWFADMNSETSFSGTSIITVIPPIIQRSSIDQNIMIKGLGLNLVTNFDTTAEENKSYVGIYPDNNNNGTQQIDEIDIPAINYSRIGDNQTIIGQFLLDSSVSLGKYKVKIKNAGVPAIGDAYITLVNNLVNITYVQGEIRLISGTSTLNTTDDTTAFLTLDANIKNASANLSTLTDPIVNWLDGNILNGIDDWWVVYSIENNSTMSYTNSFIARLGLTSLTGNGFLSPEFGVINVYNNSGGLPSQQQTSVGILNGGQLNKKGNLSQVNYIKVGNILTILLIGTDNTTYISSVIFPKNRII